MSCFQDQSICPSKARAIPSLAFLLPFITPVKLRQSNSILIKPVAGIHEPILIPILILDLALTHT